MCCVCNNNINTNFPSVKCNKCNRWCHFRKNKDTNCSQLKSFKEYSLLFTCSTCCQTTHNPTPTSNPNPPPNHPPQIDKQKEYDLKILQFNCNGIKGKFDEIRNYILKNEIKIAALQETKLNTKSKLSDIPNFTTLRHDRAKDSGGGLIFFIHEDLPFQRINNTTNDDHLEYLAIKIGDTTIANIYIPPTSSCAPNYSPNIDNLLQLENALILGDFNAHDTLWHSSISDARGQDFSNKIIDSNFGILNLDTPTRLPTSGQPTSPDLSLASLSLLPYTSWETSTTLGSDHLPITIKCSTSITPQYSEKQTFINFKKANWQEFTEQTESEFSKLNQPTDVYKGEQCFRKIINKISKYTIPKGRIKKIIPEIPSAAMEKINTRDEIRKNTPDSPQINELNREINTLIKKHKQEKWQEEIGNIERKTDPSKLFKLLKRLNGQPTDKRNQGIKFKGKYISSAKQMANHFNQQYSSVVRHTSSKMSRNINRETKKNNLSDTLVITPGQTTDAIKATKASKAIGPDGISNLHLKHLGTNGINYLTSLYNLSLTTSQIPQIWKQSVIIPLLKPKKPPDESKSYRPVSLLSPAAKVLEKLILPELDKELPIPDFQHGFRKKHSTVSALNDLNLDIVSGFNQKKPAHRTVLLQIDMSKAFDMVSHDKLITDLNRTNLHPNIKRWLSCYIHGRQSKVNFRNQTSSFRNIRRGVPQGAVISPILFNFYLTNLPRPPEGIKIIQYADDISIYSTGPSIDNLAKKINVYVNKLVEYLEERELLISEEKSTVTLFTPSTHEANVTPNVLIKGKKIALEKTPRVRGVILDTMHTFSILTPRQKHYR